MFCSDILTFNGWLKNCRQRRQLCDDRITFDGQNKQDILLVINLRYQFELLTSMSQLLEKCNSGAYPLPTGCGVKAILHRMSVR